MKGLQQLALVSLMLGSIAACSQRSDSANPPQTAVNNAPAEQPAVVRGYVVMRYSLNGDGHPIEIEVVESSPKGIFEAEAVRVLSRWGYEMAVDHNQPLNQKDLKVRLDFEWDPNKSAPQDGQPKTDQKNTAQN